MYSEQDNQTPNETVTFNDGEEIVTFNSDGTYSSYYDSDIALGTYSYDTDNQEITTSYIYEGKTYTGVAKVMELNSISLILYYTDEDGLSYIDYYNRKK